MKKYLITYNETEIVTVSDAPEGGVIATGTNMMIAGIIDAIYMFYALEYDLEQLSNTYKNEKDGIVSY